MTFDPNVQSELSQQEELLSLEEAVKFLDTSKSTLYRLLNQEDVKGVKVGKQWRFRKADLTAYLERSPAVSFINAGARADLEHEIRYFERECADLADADASEGNANIASEMTAARLVELILELAIMRRASDIHFNPAETGARLRYRIDGVLHEIRVMSPSLHDPIIARLKEMTEMNVLEKRLPQDGRARCSHAGVDYDIRLGILPTVHGESAVARILNRSTAIIKIDELAELTGSPELNNVRGWLQRPSGMIITTGPSGSGKTTMLYSCLLEIDAQTCNVATVENPVECTLPGVLQMQVNRRSGMTYAACLNSLLRHDPDVVMCAEFRNLETAELAIELAVTGHLVLGSLHTETAPGALQRLVDIGLVPFLVGSEMIGVIGMRLTRRLCKKCKTESSTGERRTNLEAIRKLAAAGGFKLPEDATLYEPAGCPHCRNTGYRGRMLLFEILHCNPSLVRALLECKTEAERTRLAVETGMRTLLADGMYKAALGETSVDEVLRVTGTWL